MINSKNKEYLEFLKIDCCNLIQAITNWIKREPDLVMKNFENLKELVLKQEFFIKSE